MIVLQHSCTGDAMSNHQVYKLPYRRPDGTVVDVVRPTSAIDVEQQPDIPSAILATAAFAPVINGVPSFSRFTLYTFKNLSDMYGDDTLRNHLSSLLTEIQGGFRPKNPVGILIHRVRLTATETVLN